jgi:hypothetical protein
MAALGKGEEQQTAILVVLDEKVAKELGYCNL